VYENHEVELEAEEEDWGHSPWASAWSLQSAWGGGWRPQTGLVVLSAELPAGV